MRAGTCIHFNGIALDDNKCCAAGVNYRRAFGRQDGVYLRLPCFQFRTLPADGRGTYIKAGAPTKREEFDRRGEVMIPCDKYREPTEDECQAERQESDAAISRTMTVMKAIAKWRTIPKPLNDRREVIVCPICDGQLHLFQSGYTGHCHGKCETEECVAWME